jgi:hypothetical protein
MFIQVHLRPNVDTGERMKKSNNVQKPQNLTTTTFTFKMDLIVPCIGMKRLTSDTLEHDTSRVDQIMAPHNTGQAFDSSPRFSQTSDRPDTGEVTVWKSLENINVESTLSPAGTECIFGCSMLASFLTLCVQHARQ